MNISIMIEGQMGLNWPRWRRLVGEVESLGYAGLFRSDHFVMPSPPDEDSLEMIVSLTYLADHTGRIRFGQLVSPVSFRDPIMLARQAAALDQLSGGRMWFGLGAGWMDREHEMFGYDLGDVQTRMARLEEALEVVTRLLRSDAPVSFDGRFYRLRDAVISPKPPPGPRIVVGGNGMKRTLPLAARYADVWNAIAISPEAFAERCARLDELAKARGRAPSDVKRTMMTGIHPGVDREDLRSRGVLAGSIPQMRDVISRMEDSGCEELMLQWLALDDIDSLRAHAEGLLRG